jgi:hypothetical protein
MPDDQKTQAPQFNLPDYTALINGTQTAMARWMESLVQLSQEIARFTQTRWQEDIANWQTLATCNTPQQLIDCQQKYSAKVTEEYAEEISKLSQMIMTAAGQSFASVQQAQRAA